MKIKLYPKEAWALAADAYVYYRKQEKEKILDWMRKHYGKKGWIFRKDRTDAELLELWDELSDARGKLAWSESIELAFAKDRIEYATYRIEKIVQVCIDAPRDKEIEFDEKDFLLLTQKY